jgi:D-glycero-D-manno-heptose 1,7-bisphosphate phosphatase
MLINRIVLNLLLSNHTIIDPLAVIWHRTNNFFDKEQILYLSDIDGTLWPDTGPGSPLRPFEFFDSWRRFSRLSKFKRPLMLITNQTHFARQKEVSLSEVFLFYFRMFKLLRVFNATALMFCFHHPDANFDKLRKDCIFRKPSCKMINRAMNLIDHCPKNAMFFGDRITDMIAGTAGKVAHLILIDNPQKFHLNVSTYNLIEDYAFFEISSIREIDKYLHKFENDR